MPRDQRQGADINWQVFGTGERPALALHCMLGTSDLWGPVLTPLGDRISATAIDLPGHGLSADWDPDGDGGDYQGHATRVAASFIDRPLDLIGHSFGAVVALRIAVAAPHAIRSLTLIEPVLFSTIAGTPEWLEWRAKQDRLDALLGSGRMEEGARAFMADWGAGVPWDALPERQRARFTRQMPIVASVSSANFTDPGAIGREGGFEAIDAPTLLICGEESPNIMLPACEAIAARLPDVGLARVPGAGHMMPLTHARQVSDLIAMNLERS